MDRDEFAFIPPSFWLDLQHTYLSYGPLLCGATNVIYEGVPSYPSPSRCWDIVEKYKVLLFSERDEFILTFKTSGGQANLQWNSKGLHTLTKSFVAEQLAVKSVVRLPIMNFHRMV